MTTTSRWRCAIHRGRTTLTPSLRSPPPTGASLATHQVSICLFVTNCRLRKLNNKADFAYKCMLYFQYLSTNTLLKNIHFRLALYSDQFIVVFTVSFAKTKTVPKKKHPTAVPYHAHSAIIATRIKLSFRAFMWLSQCVSCICL